MPEGLADITIALNRGNVTITRDARQALMARLQHVRDSSSLRATIDAVGSKRAVELNPAQRATLLGLLQAWSTDVDDAMPADLTELRDALREDLSGLA